jgi:DHA1 family multidrug resistance protein-like MFS transporter
MRWGYPRAAVTLAVGNCLFDAACNIWWWFIPLYLIEVGHSTPAEAVYWLAVAATAQAICRMVSGPLWGVLSDRYGRKLMYMRALFFLVVTSILFGFITEPWQVVIALALHGLFSGYDGPAVAMLSVSVPDSHFKKSLGLFTALRYLGQSAGPALGAALAVAFTYRTTILISAALNAAIMLWIFRAVPSDRIAPASGHSPGEPSAAGTPGTMARPALERFRPSSQLWLAVFIFGMLVALAQVLRITTPIALRTIEGQDAPGITGIAFMLGGLASAVGVFIVSGRYFRIGRLRIAMVVCTCVTGLAFLGLGIMQASAPFVAVFALISLTQAAMIPTSNMLIAFNTPAARRGTAFGLGGSAQAIAIAVGPMAAALFVATSMAWGFAAIGLVCAALAVLMHRRLREPRPEQSGAQ